MRNPHKLSQLTRESHSPCAHAARRAHSEVELLTGGELTHSSARSLSDRGWGLLIPEDEMIRFIREATERCYVDEVLERLEICVPNIL